MYLFFKIPFYKATVVLWSTTTLL